MTHHTEILFIDPSVADIASLLAGLRPEVGPIALAADRPAASQMAEVLAWRIGSCRWETRTSALCNDDGPDGFHPTSCAVQIL